MPFRVAKQFLLSVVVFLVIVSPSVVITYYSYQQIEQDLTSQVYAERQALARQSVRIVESRLDGMRDVGRTAARDIADTVEQGNWEEAVNEISYISAEFPFVDRIFLSDLAGHTTAYYPPSPENVNKDFSFRDWYKGVSKEWMPYASEVFKRAPYPQYNTVAMMAPIKNKDGQPLGAIGLAINLDSFYDLSNNFRVDKGGFLYIVNQKGQIVAHPKYPSQGPIADYSSVPVVQKALRGESGVGVNFNPVENEDRLAAYEPVPNYNWGVVVSDPVSTAFSERDATLNRIKNLYIFIISLSFVLAALVVIALQKIQASRNALMVQSAQDEAMLSSIGDAVFAINRKKQIILFNKAAETISGYSHAEAIGKPYDQVLKFSLEKDGSPVTQFVDDALKGVAGKMMNHTLIVRKDGSTVPVADSAAPIWNQLNEIQGVVVVFRDVTKETEVDRMKSEFISIASHQLKSPLTAMRWHSELLLDNYGGELSQEQKDSVEAIQQSNIHMIDLVNTLLNVSRIESGRMIIEPVPTNLKELIEGVIEEVQQKILEKKQTLTIDIAKNIPELMIDPKLMRQVYLNLLTNANKYTPNGGTITLKVVLEKDQVLTSITDTGAGIPEADKKRVFQKFYRGENILKSGNEGTGLGLYLVKIIMEASGCNIWFDSTEGKGTTFYFTIPLAGIKAHKGEVQLS